MDQFLAKCWRKRKNRVVMQDYSVISVFLHSVDILLKLPYGPSMPPGSQLPGFAPGEMRVRIWTESTDEARTTYAIEALSPDSKWCVRAFLGVDQQQRLAVTRLEVWPSDTEVVAGAPLPAGLASFDLRQFPLGRWLAQAQAQLADEDFVAQTGVGYDPMLKKMGYERASEDRKQWARQVSEEARSCALRRGRRGYGDDHYRRIALAYLDLQRQGVTRGIQQRLAEQEGRQWQTIRDWVSGATKRGFLTPGKQGRAGRLPGPRLYDDGSLEDEQ